jgi:hypothetical protein
LPHAFRERINCLTVGRPSQPKGDGHGLEQD